MHYSVFFTCIICPKSASQSMRSSKEAFDIINSNSSSYYEKRKKRVKEVNFRSKLNYFAFHLSNPIAIFLRNIVLKLLVKNRKFWRKLPR